MFWATSSSCPGSPENTSYWPSTLPERYAKTVPACTPVALEPISRVTLLTVPRRVSWSMSGVITCCRPSTFAATQSRRSTTRTGGCSTRAVRPVYSWTWRSARSVRFRSSVTTSAASAYVTFGPDFTSAPAVATARSQSTICVISPRYVPHARLARSHPDRARFSNRRSGGRGGPARPGSVAASGTAAACERGGDPVQAGLRGVLAAARDVVGDRRERELPAAVRDQYAGERAHPRQ